MSAGLGIGSFLQGIGSGYSAVRQADLNDALLKARERELALASTTPAASGDATPATTSQTTLASASAVTPSSGGGGTPSAMFTADNAAALRESAKRLGVDPGDLATVISYETGGSFSPGKWGGKGGNYMGLIQFGPEERNQFGANDKQGFAEQLPAVEKYLTTRGFKPGMGLEDLYSTVLAGRPGLYDRRDQNGSVREHVANMGDHKARAQMFLNLAQPQAEKPYSKDPRSPGTPDNPLGPPTPKSISSGSLTSKKSADAISIMNELFPEQRSIIS